MRQNLHLPFSGSVHCNRLGNILLETGDTNRHVVVLSIQFHCDLYVNHLSVQTTFCY